MVPHSIVLKVCRYSGHLDNVVPLTKGKPCSHSGENMWQHVPPQH